MKYLTLRICQHLLPLFANLKHLLTLHILYHVPQKKDYLFIFNFNKSHYDKKTDRKRKREEINEMEINNDEDDVGKITDGNGILFTIKRFIYILPKYAVN